MPVSYFELKKEENSSNIVFTVSEELDICKQKH